MNRVLALVWKDLRLFAGDRKAMLITFLVPIVIASFFGFVFGGSNGGGAKPAVRIPVLVVDEDGGPLVKEIVDGLRKGTTVAPKIVDRAEADRAVKAGTASTAVIFARGFGEAAPRAMMGGEPPTVELRYDPSKSLEMQVAQGAVMQATIRSVSVAAFGDSPAAGRAPVTMRAVPQTSAKAGEADTSGIAHSFAGMAMQGVLFYGINAAMAMLRDRRQGIWRRLRASPVGLGELLLGKAVSITVIGAFVLAGVLAFGMLAFGVRVSGSWTGLLAVLLATALMVAAFGMLVASLGRTEEQSRGLSTVALLVMVMLGGAWFPTFLMPAWVQRISYLVPVRWALDGFDAMLWRGGGFASVFAPIGGLLAFALIFGALAAFRFRTMPETA